MIPSYQKLLREVEIGDLVNDIAIVTEVGLSTIRTDEGTYCKAARADRNYKKVWNVKREGKLIYKSKWGGKR